MSLSFFNFFTINRPLNLEQYANIAFPLYSTTISVFAIARIATALLLLGVFIQHSGEFTRFLHRLGSAYLIYYRLLDTMGVVLRFSLVDSPSLLELRQEDSLFFRLFFVYSTLVVALFFFGVAERFFLSKSAAMEFPILIFFLHFGGLFVLRLHTLRDLLIALERVTLASYVLATFERQNRFSTYAGVQYFLLGSVPSARLIVAFSLFYFQGGSLVVQDLDLLFGNIVSNFNGKGITSFFGYQDSIMSSIFNTDIAINITNPNTTFWYRVDIYSFGIEYFSIVDFQQFFNYTSPITSLTLLGLFFLFFNLLFKLTAAPFHVWAPSVYGKAPIASVTFLSIYSKVRVLFFLFKLLNTFLHSFSFFTRMFLLFSGVLSIFIGRVGAFTEKRIKRFFVYSSRGHVGFRLAGLSLTNLEGATSSFHYLAVYIISSLLRWFLLLNRGRDKNHLSHFSEMKVNNPFRGLVFAFLVFSMSGIPPFGGFFIKLDVLSALLDNSHFFTNYILFFFTVASFFYYLRLIKIIFFDYQDAFRFGNLVPISGFKSVERPQHVGRIWMRMSIILILGVYLFIVQKPIIAIRTELLVSVFL